jgi:hypothetical protein
MSATLNYREYVTPSLSTYPWFSHYSSSTHHKRNLGTSSSMFPVFALSSAPPSCHRGREAGAAGVDEGVPDLASARSQIRLVVIGAKLGRGSDPACTVIEAVLPPSADQLLLMNRRGSCSS